MSSGATVIPQSAAGGYTKEHCLDDALNNYQEMLNLFHAYVGGLFLSPNQHVINEWIRGLLEPEIEFLRSRTDPSLHIHLLEQNLPSPKRTKSEGITPDLRSSYPMQSKPQPAPRVIKQIPPLQAMAVLPNPLAPAQPGLPFLPLFNQAAMQRRVTVEYIAEFSGPSHAGRWTVKCVGKCFADRDVSGQRLRAGSERNLQGRRSWAQQANCERGGGTEGVLFDGVDMISSVCNVLKDIRVL